jgi:CRP-like cAMP-binding protein
VARVLLRLARDFPHERPCGLGIDVPLTQQDVADLVAARREVVSTWLTRLKRDGVLDTHHGQLCIHDADALAKMSS